MTRPRTSRPGAAKTVASGSRGAEHFRQIYAHSDDPWGFASSAYEQEKFDSTVGVLGDRRFHAGLEAGCSIGVLTRLLADRCERLLGVDLVEEPLATARARCADKPGVSFQQMRIPDQWPEGRFDLIVLSEVLYFLSPPDIARCADRVLTGLLSGGAVLLVNWLGETDDPCTGDEAAEHFIAATRSALTVVRAIRRPGYRIDLLTAD